MKKLTVKDILAAKGIKKLSEVYTHNPLEAESCELAEIEMTPTSTSTSTSTSKSTSTLIPYTLTPLHPYTLIPL